MRRIRQHGRLPIGSMASTPTVLASTSPMSPLSSPSAPAPAGPPVASASFDLMAQSFAERVWELKGLMMLRAVEPPPDLLVGNLAKIDEQLRSVEAAFVALQGAVSAEKQCISHAQDFADKVRDQGELLQQIMAALPAQVPGRNAAASTATTATTLGAVSASEANASSAAGGGGPAAAGVKSWASTIEKYVTVAELGETPGYVKGRLGIEKVNASVGAQSRGPSSSSSFAMFFAMLKCRRKVRRCGGPDRTPWPWHITAFQFLGCRFRRLLPHGALTALLPRSHRRLERTAQHQEQHSGCGAVRFCILRSPTWRTQKQLRWSWVARRRCRKGTKLKNGDDARVKKWKAQSQALVRLPTSCQPAASSANRASAEFRALFAQFRRERSVRSCPLHPVMLAARPLSGLCLPRDPLKASRRIGPVLSVGGGTEGRASILRQGRSEVCPAHDA